MAVEVFPLKDPGIWFDYNVAYHWQWDIFSAGVIPDAGSATRDDLKVEGTGSLAVKVKAGRAYVQGGAGRDMRCFALAADSTSSASNPDWKNTFSPAAAQPRIDRVVASIYDASRRPGDLTKEGKLEVLTGTPTAGANLTNLSGAPSLGLAPYSLLLANVLVNGATIPDANIDTRLYVIRPRALIGKGDVPVSNLISHTEYTAGHIDISNSTDGTAHTIVTAPPFYYDGRTTIMIHFYAPRVISNGGTNMTVTLILNDGAATLCQLGVVFFNNPSGYTSPVSLFHRRTPVEGTRVYSIRAFQQAGISAAVYGGPGGAAAELAPAFLNIRLDQ